MMTTTKRQILHMYRFAAQFKVFLDCSHAFQCDAARVDKDQLFIGKRIVCRECAEIAEIAESRMQAARREAQEEETILAQIMAERGISRIEACRVLEAKQTRRRK